MRQLAITTTDNPFNVITEFEEWYSYDIKRGYWTCHMLQDAVKYTSMIIEEKMVAIGNRELTRFSQRCYDVYHDKKDYGILIAAMYLMILAEHCDSRLPEGVKYKIVFED